MGQYKDVNPSAGDVGGVKESLLVKPTWLLAFDSWASCISQTPPMLPLPDVHIKDSNTVNQAANNCIIVE